MNAKSNYFGLITLVLVFLTVMSRSVYSQGSDSRVSSFLKDKLYAGITLNPLMTNIANEKFSAVSPLNSKKGSSINVLFDFGYYFNRIAGVSIGLGYGSYSTQISLDSCSIKYNTTDTESETYEMRIKGKSIVEDQKISFLSIPVTAIFRIPAGDKLGFFFKGGISFDIPISKTYKGSGTFTYDGYYPAYPVLLQNIPDYFPSNLNTLSSGDLQIKSFNMSLIASGGAYYFLNDKLQLTFGFQYNKSLSNISAYETNPDFRLSSKANELNSVMAGSPDTGYQAFGLSIGIKYYLR
jgi:hypothetical protein